MSALDDDPSCQDLLLILKVLPERVDAMYRKGDIQHATIAIMTALQEANAFFQNHEPWAMAKQLRSAAAIANEKRDSLGLEGGCAYMCIFVC